jgi:hypothetical protein
MATTMSAIRAGELAAPIEQRRQAEADGFVVGALVTRKNLGGRGVIEALVRGGRARVRWSHKLNRDTRSTVKLATLALI